MSDNSELFMRLAGLAKEAEKSPAAAAMLRTVCENLGLIHEEIAEANRPPKSGDQLLVPRPDTTPVRKEDGETDLVETIRRVLESTSTRQTAIEGRAAFLAQAARQLAPPQEADPPRSPKKNDKKRGKSWTYIFFRSALVLSLVGGAGFWAVKPDTVQNLYNNVRAGKGLTAQVAWSPQVASYEDDVRRLCKDKRIVHGRGFMCLKDDWRIVLALIQAESDGNPNFNKGVGVDSNGKDNGKFRKGLVPIIVPKPADNAPEEEKNRPTFEAEAEILDLDPKSVHKPESNMLAALDILNFYADWLETKATGEDGKPSPLQRYQAPQGVAPSKWCEKPGTDEQTGPYAEYYDVLQLWFGEKDCQEMLNIMITALNP